MNRVGRFLGNRYEVLEPIGSGGMADVYKALDHTLNRYVAIKVLKQELNTDETFVIKFRQEAMSAASLSHPNVVNIYDVGQEDSINYIVMELCEGVTLKEYIQKKGKLEIYETINIAIQIANGIQAAHDRGIIHRDIKPQNVIITTDGKAKVTDFGIAKAVSSQTITASTVGSVHYISPEQARGSHCDGRSDIYSLGITMYEMLTGRVPFDGDSTIAVALLHIQGEMIPPSTYEPMIPVSLEKIIMKCTQKKPEQRYSSANELITDLRRALMTPNEDFVKIIRLDASGGTHIFSEDEARKIKEQTGKTGVIKTKEENDYQLGIDEEETEIEDEEEEEDVNVDSKFERVVMGIGIAVLAVIIIIAIFLVGRAFNMFPWNAATSTETSQLEETLGENQTRMPEVVGLTLEAATKLLNDNGLGRKVVEEESDKYDPGYVIRAEYTKDEVLDKNTQVILYVSVASDSVTIPESLIGKSEKAATNALITLGFVVKTKSGSSESVEKGHVYYCNPKVGTEAKVGTEVTIYISTGPEFKMVDVPDLYMKSENEAQSLLDDRGLVGKSSYDYDDTVEEGFVISQNPESGTSVKEGSTVTYVISKGSETQTTIVPSLIGKTQVQAETLLNENELKLGKVTQEYDEAEEGTVISQTVSSGTEVDKGTSVDIVISKGPEQTTQEETEETEETTQEETTKPSVETTTQKPTTTQAPETTTEEVKVENNQEEAIKEGE